MVGSLADHAGPAADTEAGTAADEREPVTVTVEGTELKVSEIIQTEVMEIREGRRDAEARVEELETTHDRQQRAAKHLTARSADRPTSEDIAALRQFAAEFGELTDRHADVVGEYADVGAAGSSDERLARLRELPLIGFNHWLPSTVPVLARTRFFGCFTERTGRLLPTRNKALVEPSANRLPEFGCLTHIEVHCACATVSNRE